MTALAVWQLGYAVPVLIGIAVIVAWRHGAQPHDRWP
jgi:hypothetical protein